MKHGRYGSSTLSGIRRRTFLVSLIFISSQITVFYFFLGAGPYISYMVSVSLTAFLFFGFDKFQALRGATRIPETNLILLTLMGGFIGSLLSMIIFRHKIRKASFWLFIMASTLAHIPIVFYIYL